MNALKQIRDVLAGRAVRGAMILGMGSGAENLLRFVRNIILVRILAPEAFGAMAIVLSVSALLESFTEVGIKEAIIQNPKGEDRRFLNGAWWLSFARAAALFASAYIASPYLARFYEIPDLTNLMRVAFLTILFNGLISSRAYAAIKRMDFKRWITVFHGGGAVGILAAIGLSFIMRNVWALAIGFTVEAAARMILSYLICPFRPRLDFDRESMRALLRYSRGMIGLPILTFIFLRCDIFVIGKLCTIDQLGQYTMAVALARIPSQFVTSVASRLVMPMFSDIQGDKDRVNDLIETVTSKIVLFFFPLFFFVAFYGESVLRLVYVPRYSAVAVPFTIVFGAEVLRIGSVPIVAFYLGSGRPELHRLFTGVRAALMFVMIYPAVRFLGATGAALAVFGATMVGYVIQVGRIREITGLDLRKYAHLHVQALGISLCVVVCWMIVQLHPAAPTSMQVAAGGLGMLLSYAFAFRQFLNSKKNTPAN
jgi:O-antigen/teichoic acid export membrane protein